MIIMGSIAVSILCAVILIELFENTDKYDQTPAVHRYYLQAESIKRRQHIVREFFNKNYPTNFN